MKIPNAPVWKLPRCALLSCAALAPLALLGGCGGKEELYELAQVRVPLVQ